MGHVYFENSILNSTGPPLAEDFDYWSISQRGTSFLDFLGDECPFKDQSGKPIAPWPEFDGCGDEGLLGLWSNDTHEVGRRLPGNPDMTDQSTIDMLDEIIKG